MYENELIDYLTKYNGFRKDYKNLFPNKEETIRLLLKITLPNDLEPSFFEMEQDFIRNMNSRIQVTDSKSLKYIDGVALFLGNPLFIKADILMDPLFSSLYQPESLMKREFSDDLLFHGGIEIDQNVYGFIIVSFTPIRFCKVFEVFRQVLLRIVPCKMNAFHSHTTEHICNFIVHKSDV